MMLRELSEARGVAGDEGRVRELIRKEASRWADELRVDALGNLIAVRHGCSDLPRVMGAAHMDEVGLMVSSIQKNGLLKFLKVGGIDDRVLPSTVVLVGDDEVPGVIGAKPVHAQKPGEQEKVISHRELFIDIGAADEDAAKEKVKPGDYVSFDTDYEELGDGILKGKAFDDRVGCAVLLDLLRAESEVPLHAVFTVQEEVGLRGAQVAAWSVDPDMALVFEGTVCADIPGSEEHEHVTTMGDGPALGLMDRTSMPHPTMLRQMIRVAEEKEIPYQFRNTTAGGNDAGPIHLSRGGVPTAKVSVPCRYIHSPLSVLSESDYRWTVRLVTAFVQSIEGGFRP